MAIAVMPIKLGSHQLLAIDKLKSGSILCGGVGSGKSRTAIAYYFLNECFGKLEINGKGTFTPMKKPKDLYIITTARKRDTLDWEKECAPFLLSTNPKVSICGVKVVVDSWNNIKKYVGVKNAFFIFDEQRVVGSGTWVKAFLKIVKVNHWILLSATPGDTWMDYIPVFIANGFYKNRTEFLRRHVVYNTHTQFPMVDHYVDCGHLAKLKNQIIVYMKYAKKTTAHDIPVAVQFSKEKFDEVAVKRWNAEAKEPIKNVSELYYQMRKVVNSDPSRLKAIYKILERHEKIIVFYNFNYELEALENLAKDLKVPVAEWNGHKHELIPKKNKWIYLVQYTAGAEGWNCIETNCIVFFSQNYSYKIMVQSAGRIDRLNTPFTDLYYYHLLSKSKIDGAIAKALSQKQNFNENKDSREKHML
ncbi:MAG: helicase-related protein [Lactococcus chungangensis]|nr:helicase-related protein [Lactococcus chungangensis]